MCTIPVIDLFAGPGGLGEGFSQYKSNDLNFKIVLSIEKDESAHKTLELRAFFRQFKEFNVPDEYYKYLDGNISRKELFESYPEEAKAASEEAWLHELNISDINKVMQKTKSSLSKFDSKHWILIGGPPCQAYSLVGRARMSNHMADFESDHRHFLYQHYLRIVASLSPSIFIMENVKGFLSASVKGEKIFDRVLFDLEYPGQAVKKLDEKTRAPSSTEYDIYSLVVPQELDENNHVLKLKPQDYIIRSEDYGIPQNRHRVILMGVRKDLDPVVKTRLLKSEDSYSVNDVINDLPKVRSSLSSTKDSWVKWKSVFNELINRVSFNKIDKKTRDEIINVYSRMDNEVTRGGNRIPFSKKKFKNEYLTSWYSDERLETICNHEAKSHMKKDLWRYIFSSCYARAHKVSPRLKDYPNFLLPKHKNLKDIKIKDAKWSDRFKVQIGDLSASTVTSHISKDGHYFIHHDPSQCRAWTVREAARVQTFPDNYFFEGTRTSQYHQVGNAVPPLLAHQIAEVVAEYLKEM